MALTSREKASELYNKCLLYINSSDKIGAKACACICVDEIDRLIVQSTPKDDPYANLPSLEYWQEVKEEIQKI